MSPTGEPDPDNAGEGIEPIKKTPSSGKDGFFIAHPAPKTRKKFTLDLKERRSKAHEKAIIYYFALGRPGFNELFR